MFAGHDQALLELLTGYPGLSVEVLNSAWNRHLSGEGSFGDILVELGCIRRADLLAMLAPKLGCEWLELLPVALGDDLLKSVPCAIARHYEIIPIAVDEECLTVVPASKWPVNWREELTFALGKPVKVVLADPEVARILWQRHYAAGRASEIPANGKAAAAVEADLNATDMAEMAGLGVVINLVNSILRQAIRDHASDIHFEPFADEFKVRFRLDGGLHDLPPLNRSFALPVISRLKVLANLDIAERRLPQDGRIRWAAEGRTVDLRVSTLPTQDGESVVLRVLDQTSAWLNLGQLGLPAAMRANVKSSIHRPNGLIVVTGPTGSGKTTTLYGCLKELNRADRKLLTIEDPVEYAIDGIMQVAVDPGAGLTFARALRSFLRQDPDVVMVGEIRDEETARIAIQAALTGHLVLTTLHTPDATSAVNRLTDMGIEPFLLAATLELIVAQRLVRRLCPSCKQATPLDAAMAEKLNVDINPELPTEIFHPVGCPQCHQSGYRGRWGLFECLPLSERLREMITARESVQDMRAQSRLEGVASLRDSACMAVFAGETSIDEIIKSI